MLKNKFAVIILFLALIFPVCAVNGEFAENQEPAEIGSIETIQETDDSQITESVEKEVIPKGSEEKITQNLYKQPVSKKKTAKKFILAMLGVGISSLIIYFGLTLYNKIRDGFSVQTPDYPETDKLLESPDDITEAVRSFLNKTNW